MRSIEHGLYLVVEGWIVQIVDFDGLEIFLGVEVPLSDQESLSQHQFLPLNKPYLYFGIVVVHHIVVGVPFLLVDLQEVGHLLSCQLLSFVARWLVVHHFVELR